MSQITAKAAAILNARPADVYAIIADYQRGHPRILPKGRLYDLRVEQGGYGDGTIIRFKVKTLGFEQSAYQRVSEPEPGRVLMERDIDSPRQATTTFSVTPIDEGQQARVEIVTTMNSSPGFRGLVERLLMPRIQPPVYRRELKLLEAVAQQRNAPHGRNER
jgi:hypothetical protein